MMGRSYGACLGCLALAGSIVFGLISQSDPDSVLLRSISMLIVFTFLGWIIGESANQAVRHSVEMNYRANFERLRERTSEEDAK